ncbi:permease-like cell division protein FtsX [Paenibacillus alginolyticus]|uniref:Cell division protein FtsX n=1 Tax=Paenibacillus alginolyticus TaxID=59839 RepID=A0ABT4G894_9BACL|nr:MULTISPECIES: permease-like cell division protein FtsX [Paenibacillus]MCY9692401.1 permease-like cell division protein FtsX [Paenibacillus alginolyticus]MEC0143626.1 permease-like cell division protein FtsX [Paenibacillus alginolyticus]NRF93700.1 ABC transporter permease [Paenibacillus frigoriresistens]
MKISTVSRHLREGTKNVVRNGWMTFASISSIAISLFILGVFVLITLNVNDIAGQIEKQVEINVYLEVNTSQDQMKALETQIQAIHEVKSIKFVSKEEGLVYLRQKLGESGKALLDGFEGDNNPLNDAFTIEVDDPRNVAVVADQISALNIGKDPKPIYKVNYGKGTVEALFKVTQIVRWIGIGIVILLSFTAVFLIANTIKITILARRKEISIMKLVGATNSFIRWPFFIEGALLGFIGSVIPTAIILGGYWKLLNTSSLNLNLLMVELTPFGKIAPTMTALLLGIGMVIGIWGSLISVRKFLRV